MIHWRKGTWYGAATGEGRGTMNTTTIRFLKAGMAYLLLGGFLGVLLSLPVTRDALYASHPGARWGLAHAHIVLAGVVMMVIFGIAYHILPRVAGEPPHSEGGGAAPFWLAAPARPPRLFGAPPPRPPPPWRWGSPPGSPRRSCGRGPRRSSRGSSSGWSTFGG